MNDPVVRLARYRDQVLARLADIERVVAAWEAGTLAHDARASGATEVHRLAGTLGAFGEDAGSEYAGELELALKQEHVSATDAAAAARCRTLAGQLRARVDAALAEGEISPASGGTRHADHAILASVAPASSASPGVEGERGATILVADDDDVIAHLLTIALGRHGYAIIRAHDGAEAIERVGVERVDLVFMDVQMPRLNGLAACRALRSDARQAQLPIVVMTAQGGPDDESIALAAGATVCLAKPFSVAHVRELARTWAGRPHPS